MLLLRRANPRVLRRFSSGLEFTFREFSWTLETCGGDGGEALRVYFLRE